MHFNFGTQISWRSWKNGRISRVRPKCVPSRETIQRTLGGTSIQFALLLSFGVERCERSQTSPNRPIVDEDVVKKKDVVKQQHFFNFLLLGANEWSHDYGLPSFLVSIRTCEPQAGSQSNCRSWRGSYATCLCVQGRSLRSFVAKIKFWKWRRWASKSATPLMTRAPIRLW